MGNGRPKASDRNAAPLFNGTSPLFNSTQPLLNGTRPVSENPATAGLCGPFANSIQDSLRISSMRAKRRALMAQLIACCSWSAYGRWAPKKVGGPAVVDAVSSVDYPPVAALVEPLKPAKRHQAPKGKGRAKTHIRPLTACESVQNPSRMGRGGVFQCRNGVWLSCVKTSHSAIHAVFAVCNRRLPPLTLCPVYRGYLHRGGCPTLKRVSGFAGGPESRFQRARVVVAGGP